MNASEIGTTAQWAELPRDPHDALTLENDIVGVRVWGPPAQPTLSIGRADLWDRRWFADRQPLVTLARLSELAMTDRLSEVAPETNRTVYDLYHRYDFPCPKPGGQMILGLPFAVAAQARTLPDGAIELSAEGHGKRLTATIRLMLTRPLVMTSCHAQRVAQKDCWLRVYRHRDTILPCAPVDSSLGSGRSAYDFEPLPPPRAVRHGAMFGVAQDFSPDMTFPDGFTAALGAALLDCQSRIELHEHEHGLGTPLWAEREGRIDHGVVKRYTPINEAPGAVATALFASAPADAFTILAAITTTQDAPDAVAALVSSIEAARALGTAGLLDEQRAAVERHRRPHRARVRVRQAGVEAAAIYGVRFVETRREGDTLELAATESALPNLRKPGGFYSDVPPCTVGGTKLWFQDAGLWHNDFHLNEIRAEPMLTLGLTAEIMPFCDLIATMLPMAEENAREVYGLPGAMYPLVHFPLRCHGVAHTNLTWEQDMGLNGLVSKPLWLYYRHTGDREFLRDLAWPVLRACARFCRAYLTEGADGRLHIVPTVSPEHWGLTASFERNRDCLSALTLTRYLFKAAARAADILGIASDETREWAAAAGRLAPYPTCETREGTVWVDVAGAPPIEYNIPVPLSAVFWGDDVGLDSPSEVLELALRTMRQIRIWEPHRPYLNWCVRHRLGVWTDDAQLAPESFLLSYQSLRIFPNVPPDCEIAMENFAAEGGFRVTASRTASGDIADVAILSTLGGPCRVANPWPGSGVVVKDKSAVSARAAAGRRHVEFDTKPGCLYRLHAKIGQAKRDE